MPTPIARRDVNTVLNVEAETAYSNADYQLDHAIRKIAAIDASLVFLMTPRC